MAIADFRATMPGAPSCLLAELGVVLWVKIKPLGDCRDCRLWLPFARVAFLDRSLLAEPRMNVFLANQVWDWPGVRPGEQSLDSSCHRSCVRNGALRQTAGMDGQKTMCGRLMIRASG